MGKRAADALESFLVLIMLVILVAVFVEKCS